MKFEVSFSSRPFAPVYIPAASSDLREGYVSEGSDLEILPENWDEVALVIVTGQDDPDCSDAQCPDGTKPYTVTIGPTESDDPAYDGHIFTFDMTNIDNDIARLTIKQNGKTLAGLGSPVDETGLVTSFDVRLPNMPIADTTIEVWSDDPEEGVLDKSILVFQRTNYATYQTVSVTGQDDDEIGCGALRQKKDPRWGQTFNRGTGTERCDPFGNSRFAVVLNTTSEDPRYKGVSWKFDMYQLTKSAGYNTSDEHNMHKGFNVSC